MSPDRVDIGAVSGHFDRLLDRVVNRITGLVDDNLPKPLSYKVPRDHRDPDWVFYRRRRVVAAVSVGGASLLGLSLSMKPGSKAFYLLTMGVAGTWVTGGLASGPLHLGWIETRSDRRQRPIVTPIATGVGAFGFFYGSALVARRIPFLNEAITTILQFADEGDSALVTITTCANGLAEEVFFRGALYAALGDRHPVEKSTAIYTLATVPTRNPSLVLAAGVMGSLFGLQRRATGGIQASALSHLTWSLLMLRYLPPLFRADADGDTARAPART